MTLFDLVRLAAISTFGIGVGFMLLTNWIAFKVLRPPKQLGFLWWHVTSISLSFLCLGIVAVEFVASRLGDPPGWRSALTLLGTTLFAFAQVIIFSVERKRLVDKQARDIAEAAGSNGGR